MFGFNANITPTRQVRGAAAEDSSLVNQQEAENVKKTIIRLTEIAERDRAQRAAAGQNASSASMRISSIAQFKSYSIRMIKALKEDLAKTQN